MFRPRPEQASRLAGMGLNSPTLRSSTAAATTTAAQPDADTHKMKPITWRSVIPFSLPPDPETAAVRTVRNLILHRLYYTLFLWVVLFITLIPQRHVSLFCLITTSHAGVTYALVLRAYPSVAAVLDGVIDRRLVVGVLVIAVVVEMVLTEAAKHLLLSCAGVAPVVLLHALFWVGGVGWPAAAVQAVGEMEKLVDENGRVDLEAGHQ